MNFQARKLIIISMQKNGALGCKKNGMDSYFSFTPIHIVKNLITDNIIDAVTKLFLEQVGIKVW